MKLTNHGRISIIISMNKSPSNLVPITEVNEYSDIVNFACPLPDFIDQERIGINLEVLEKICNIIGIVRLNIFGHYQKEETETPSIVSVNIDGSAQAGLAKSKTIIKRDSASSKLLKINRYNQKCFHYYETTISLDLVSIRKGIMEKETLFMI